MCKAKRIKMFKNKVLKLINDYHIKRNALIDLIGSNRVTFAKKLENNSFEPDEQKAILNKYGSLL